MNNSQNPENNTRHFLDLKELEIVECQPLVNIAEVESNSSPLKLRRSLRPSSHSLFPYDHLEYYNKTGNFTPSYCTETSASNDNSGNMFQALLEEYKLSDNNKKNQGCTSCLNYHGQTYNKNHLVCAIHPYGLKDCPDFEELRTQEVELKTGLKLK